MTSKNRCYYCQEYAHSSKNNGSIESINKSKYDDESNSEKCHSNESSFIHLNESHSHYHPDSQSDQSKNKHIHLLDVLYHKRKTSSLVKALEEEKHEAHLCETCLERLNLALNNHVEKVHKECKAYIDAVETKESNTMIRVSSHEDESINDLESNNDQAISIFQDEINNLAAAHQQQKSLNQHLEYLLIQQEQRAYSISIKEDQLLYEMNALELRTKNLQDENREIASECQRAQEEIQALMDVELISMLFCITNFHTEQKIHGFDQMDIDSVHHSRDMKYPTINGLRLVYRSNENVKWQEINTAWAQVALLLFNVGGILDYSSKNFRIVPLTTCAKIIQITSNAQKKKIEHNLGQDIRIVKSVSERSSSKNEQKLYDKTDFTLAKSLRVLNNLLFHLVDCAHETKKQFACPLPYEMSPSRIGNAELSEIGDKDDLSWLYIVNAIAANLDWISKCVGLSFLPADDFY